jgi:transposase
MKPYSEDLRWRVVLAVDSGQPREEVAWRFAVSLPTIKRWLRQRRATGELAPKPVPGPARVKTVGLAEALPARLAEHGDATLAEQCAWWRECSGQAASVATMSRAIAALGWTRKKSR